MTARLHFTTAAERDLTAAFLWYEARAVGLGSRLLTQVNHLLLRVSENPRQFPTVVDGYRRALLPRFPYGLYFSATDDAIRVHAVLHLHRAPAHWRRRLSGDSD